MSVGLDRLFANGKFLTTKKRDLVPEENHFGLRPFHQSTIMMLDNLTRYNHRKAYDCYETRMTTSLRMKHFK